MHIVLRRGLSIRIAGEPDPTIDRGCVVDRVGLRGRDLGAIRAEILVEPGARVSIGTPVLRDRKRPELIIVAPLSGTIERIEIGARRRLSEVIIAGDGGHDAQPYALTDAGTPQGLRALLLAAGQWPALRSRPFERIADPQASPKAIFVTAIDTTPHAPDPVPIITARIEDFAHGVQAMGLLADCPVHVCQPDCAPFVSDTGPISTVRFSGLHPAGLVGTHIAHLCAPGEDEVVWHVGYQDILAIGHLLRTGRIDPVRIVALSGPGLRRPRLAEVPLGADLHRLSRPDLGPGPKAILSGSMLWGTESVFLGRYHLQASVIAREPSVPRHWLIEALGKAQLPAPFIPTRALENALGPDRPVVPLLRALSIGDVEAAQRLGCEMLAEDDLALARYVTGGHIDFGKRLRSVLDAIEAGA